MTGVIYPEERLRQKIHIRDPTLRNALSEFIGTALLLVPSDPSLRIIQRVAGTALLMFFVCVIIDKRIAIPGWVHPFLFGFVVIMIGTSVGMNVGYPINPARDLGPRIFMLFIGYGSQAFTYHDYYFWIPIIAPLVGAVLAAWTYHLFIGCHIPDPKPVVLSMDEAKQLLR
ncbi:hypothetical protein ANCCEY_06107 [Ancylostoma ceylanicum]|uniref:Aquaporin-9 domain protein n=1 Tax=Ancylostoma ceylanicum TaxID=53326 RepID=A0A0D6LRX0_9BILA|nr:hypothetical protein ANCCEY_06107 [Ancylostoma ceylanicum]